MVMGVGGAAQELVVRTREIGSGQQFALTPFAEGIRLTDLSCEVERGRKNFQVFRRAEISRIDHRRRGGIIGDQAKRAPAFWMGKTEHQRVGGTNLGRLETFRHGGQQHASDRQLRRAVIITELGIEERFGMLIVGGWHGPCGGIEISCAEQMIMQIAPHPR